MGEISKKYDTGIALHFTPPRIQMERFNKKIKDYEIHFKIQFLSIFINC